MRKLFSIALVFAVWTPSFAFNYFGWQGRDGSNGYSGDTGSSGPSATVFARGQQEFFDLSGEDGTDGYSGAHGESARSCNAPYRPAYDLRGASGGNGGKGGNGGAGGDGGRITVYYTDLAQVKNISVQSRGGRSGRAGSGGDSGYGCQCREYRWHVEYCNNHGCYIKTHYCYNGSRGYAGSWGYAPPDGRNGTLVLIKREDLLAPDIFSGSASFNYLDQSKVNLAENIWSVKNGALGILAPGSTVSDTYENFEERRNYYASFKWEATRPLTDFSGESISVSLQKQGVDIVSHPRIWLSYSKVLEQNFSTLFKIKKAVFEHEVLNMESYFTGSQESTVLVIKDHANLSQTLDTSVYLKLEGDTLFNKNLFVGDVPNHLLRFSDDRVEILVGKMNIKSKYLKAGEGLIVDMKVKRTLENRSLEKRFEFTQKL